MLISMCRGDSKKLMRHKINDIQHHQHDHHQRSFRFNFTTLFLLLNFVVDQILQSLKIKVNENEM